jgi:hypothetical protein
MTPEIEAAAKEIAEKAWTFTINRLAMASGDIEPILCKHFSPPALTPPDREGPHEVETEVARFARDFYPQSSHESRMDHLLSEVEELKLATGWQDQVEEAADCALILFHIIEAKGAVPLKAMLRKLAKARKRIETGEKTTRPFPPPSGEPADEPLAASQVIASGPEAVTPTSDSEPAASDSTPQ